MSHGINLVGYLDAVLGQGESVRRFCDGLDARGPVSRLRAAAARSERAREHVPPVRHRAACASRLGAWCNPDRYKIDIAVDEPLTKGRYTIGRWAWELDEVPYPWRVAGRWLDEIWVISEFVADLLRGSVGPPVVVLPLPIAANPVVRPLDRARVGIRDDAFLLLFTFDYHSTVKRKNPLAVIAAYRRAFGAAAGTALLAGCDCYVSLHRSEGFGIALAEAIAYERPVIATGYGGNLEFMRGPQALLFSHRLVAVGGGADPYRGRLSNGVKVANNASSNAG